MTSWGLERREGSEQKLANETSDALNASERREGGREGEGGGERGREGEGGGRGC